MRTADHATEHKKFQRHPSSVMHCLRKNTNEKELEIKKDDA